MVNYEHITILSLNLFYPLSYFPSRGKRLLQTPSPTGEGWDGSNKIIKIKT